MGRGGQISVMCCFMQTWFIIVLESWIHNSQIPLEIRVAHTTNMDLTKILWVPRKSNPLYEPLTLPNLIVHATLEDDETFGHDILQMALINIATLNDYQQVIYLVVVPTTDGVTTRKDSSIHWKNSSGEKMLKFSIFEHRFVFLYPLSQE